MNKQIFYALCISGLLALSNATSASAQTTEGQSTEGKDFWVTFLQADQDPNNPLTLSLSISSRQDCQVTISNPYTSYSQTVDVTAGGLQLVEIYKDGNVLASNARAAMTATGKICYAVNSEQVDTCALHVTATADISLFATNYKKATFDATNVIPTASLLDSYMVQTFTPSDHAGASSTQGSHFAIIATEDDTEVEYCPTVYVTGYNAYKDVLNSWGQDSANHAFPQYANYQLGDTLVTPKLKKGQVYYVWTGKADNDAGDLSGTYVKARNGKKIAVFQGCPHTCIPYQKKQRDHIFSQAMPTQYWGSTFAITASKNRKRDIIRVMALNDGTEVRINDSIVHTFDFSVDTKHYWQFEIGENYSSLAAPLVLGQSCMLTTSCPCAVHLFMVSQQYDGDSKNNGDPAMLWINPIEQQIDQVTFATYQSSNGNTSHYTNIITDKPALMTLDGASIESDFQLVSGSTNYYYAQKSLGDSAVTHTLKSNGSNFIAHVYGFTKNESYGYSAGGATKPLSSSITINGQIFSADTDNSLCGTDTVLFGCNLNYNFEKIVWGFGDGTQYVDNSGLDSSSVKHYYPQDGIYQAYALIYRKSSNLCVGQSAMDSIPIKVNIGRLTFNITDVDIPCKVEGQPFMGKIYYSNESGIALAGQTINFNEAAKQAGFDDNELTITDSYFGISIPDNAQQGVEYGIHLAVNSECGNVDTTLIFMLSYDNDILSQRYTDKNVAVLGLLASYFEGQTLSNFQWYNAADSSAIEGQTSANLYRNKLEGDGDGEYYVCFTINKGTSSEVKTCACAKKFGDAKEGYEFEADSIAISGNTANAGDVIFVNVSNSAEKAQAQWINLSGNIVEGFEYDLPAGGTTIRVPNDRGFYILRVLTYTEGKKKATARNFKFYVR